MCYKHPASRPTRFIRRSAAPNNRPPASDVSAPLSKSANTVGTSTRANSLGFALHSVCIGPPVRISPSYSRKTAFDRFRGPMRYPYEKCGTNAQGRTRTARGDPDDRRWTSYNRWSDDRPIPSYRTRNRSSASAATPQARPSRAAAAENHGFDRVQSRLNPAPPVVPTFDLAPQRSQCVRLRLRPQLVKSG